MRVARHARLVDLGRLGLRCQRRDVDADAVAEREDGPALGGAADDVGDDLDGELGGPGGWVGAVLDVEVGGFGVAGGEGDGGDAAMRGGVSNGC